MSKVDSSKYTVSLSLDGPVIAFQMDYSIVAFV